MRLWKQKIIPMITDVNLIINFVDINWYQLINPSIYQLSWHWYVSIILDIMSISSFLIIMSIDLISSQLIFIYVEDDINLIDIFYCQFNWYFFISTLLIKISTLLILIFFFFINVNLLDKNINFFDIFFYQFFWHFSVLINGRVLSIDINLYALIKQYQSMSMIQFTTKKIDKKNYQKSW